VHDLGSSFETQALFDRLLYRLPSRLPLLSLVVVSEPTCSPAASSLSEAAERERERTFALACGLLLRLWSVGGGIVRFVWRRCPILCVCVCQGRGGTVRRGGYIYLAVCLSCLAVYLSVCLSVYRSIDRSVCLCLSIFLSIDRSVYLLVFAPKRAVGPGAGGDSRVLQSSVGVVGKQHAKNITWHLLPAASRHPAGNGHCNRSACAICCC